MTDGRDEAAPTASGAAAFDLLWSRLVGMLGTAATAALVRKAAAQGARTHPELGELTVRCTGIDYAYVLPAAWERAVRPRALVHLVRAELYPLLQALTGEIVVRQLDRVPELVAGGYTTSTEVEHA